MTRLHSPGQIESQIEAHRLSNATTGVLREKNIKKIEKKKPQGVVIETWWLKSTYKALEKKNWIINNEEGAYLYSIN